MQQQLYHKSLFAVKISGSRGSKYNLLCLPWITQSLICCISPFEPPCHISLSLLTGGPVILPVRPGVGEEGDKEVHEDMGLLRRWQEEESALVLPETCVVGTPWSVHEMKGTTSFTALHLRSPDAHGRRASPLLCLQSQVLLCHSRCPGSKTICTTVT